MQQVYLKCLMSMFYLSNSTLIISINKCLFLIIKSLDLSITDFEMSQSVDLILTNKDSAVISTQIEVEKIGRGSLNASLTRVLSPESWVEVIYNRNHTHTIFRFNIYIYF